MSLNKVNQTTGETTKIAGLNVIPIDTTPTEDSTNAVQSGGVFTALEGKADKPTIYNQTLTVGSTTVTFTGLPTTGNHIADVFSSNGVNYTAIDTSTSGTVILTYPVQESNITIYLKLEEVTV